MINVRSRNNLSFPGMDPWSTNLHQKKLKMLKKSWAELFRTHFLPLLPVSHLAKHFSKKMGRPTKELYTTYGACVLQQIFDLKDSALVEQLAFNQQWHYALDIPSQDEQVLSLKTLWNVRDILVSDDSAKVAFEKITDKLIEVYKVNTQFQRLDSVHIFSNMAKLGRVRLLARVCTIFLKNLKRHFPELYTDVSEQIKTRYRKETDSTYFGNVVPTSTQKRLEDIAQDLNELIEQFKSHPDVCAKYSYKSMQQVFMEHCFVENETVVVKAAQDVSTGSLQNPSDADAGYDGHKGQGYQVQLMETYTPDKSGDKPSDKDSKDLNLITHVNVEPANHYDGNALDPALKDVKERDILPKQLSADTLYGSQENKKKASAYGVELVAPTPGKKPKLNKDHFHFDATSKEVTHCPKDHTPKEIKYNKKSIRAVWSKETCSSCPLLNVCSVKKTKKGYSLSYTAKEVESILARYYEQSKTFKDKYRYRSGIEATNSRYIHMTGARRLRYRNLKRVSFAATFKALGINLFRTTKILVFETQNVFIA